jgi:hypothetical protein
MDPKEQPETLDKTTQLIETKLRIENQAKNSAAWFYWIGGLSVINSVILIAGGTFSFIFGLALTQVIDGFAFVIDSELGSIGPGVFTYIGLFLDILVAAVFIAIGYFARKGNQPVYIIGMVSYALDAVIAIAFQYWLGVLFHLIVVAGLIRGFYAFRKLAPIVDGTSSIESLRADVIDPETKKQSQKRIVILVAAIVAVCLLGYVITLIQGGM